MSSSSTVFGPPSPDINSSYTSSFTNVSSQPPITATIPSNSSTLSDNIIGAIAGGAAAFVIILLIVVFVAYSRFRRKRKKPPMLPPPNTRRFSNPREPSRISETTEPSETTSTKILWIPQRPIIHSELSLVNEDERPTSYFPMSHGGSANGSLFQQPSPRNTKPLPPSPCQTKSPHGYVNVTQPPIEFVFPSSIENKNSNVRKHGEVNEGFENSEFQNGNSDDENNSNGSYVWCDPLFQGQEHDGSLETKHQKLSEMSSRRSSLSSSNSESHYPNVSSIKNKDNAPFKNVGLSGKEKGDIAKSSEKLPSKYVNVEGLQKSPTKKGKTNLSKSPPSTTHTRNSLPLSSSPENVSNVKLTASRTKELELPESPKNDYANFHLHLITDSKQSHALNIPVEENMTEKFQLETGAEKNSSSTKKASTSSATFQQSAEIETNVATQQKAHDPSLREERTIYLNAHAVAASMPHLYGKTTHQNKATEPSPISQKTPSRADVTITPKLINAKMAKNEDVAVTSSSISKKMTNKNDVTSSASATNQKNTNKADVIIAPKPIKKMAACENVVVGSSPLVIQKGANETDSKTSQPVNPHSNQQNLRRQPLLNAKFNSAPNVTTSPDNVLQNAISQLKKVH